MASTNEILLDLYGDNKASASLYDVVGALREIVNELHELVGAQKHAKNSIRNTTNAVKEQTGAFSKLAASVKRIAFYRAIRTAMKTLTQGIKEGTNNLYYYSQALSNLDSAHAVGTMNEFATTALYVKNSIGAALMPILQSLVPIVNAIADVFINAANAVNQFFHALKGESVFTKATRYAAEYGEALGGAAGKAKELKKQIFGFDELNIFNAPSSGGGGGGTPALDYSKMFEEAELSKTMKRIRDIIEKNLGQNFAARFKVNWKEIRWDWSNLSPEDVAEKCVTALTTFLGGVTGFVLSGSLAGGLVGAVAGEVLGVYFSTIMFNGDETLSREEIADMLKTTATVLTGAAIGWAVGGTHGALLGASIAASLTALIKTFSPEAAGQMDAMLMMSSVAAVVAYMIKAAAALTVGAKVGVGGLPFIILAGLTATFVNLAWSSNFKDTKQRIGTAIASIINIVAAGAILGAVFGGGIAGALIGISIGVVLSLIITSIDWSAFDAVSKRAMEAADSKIDRQAALNYMGSPQSTGNKINGKKVTQSILKAEGKAEGGYVPAGTYFYAGEAGAELVGVVGGKTNVTNQAQFTAGMDEIMDNTNSVILQAAQAVVQAVNNKPVASFSLNDRDVVSMYDRGKTLAGEALVG